MPTATEASKPSAVMCICPGLRSNSRSFQIRICCRSSSGTPSIAVMISTGNNAEKSATMSKEVGSSVAMTSWIFSRTMSSRLAIARGVNTLLTSLRIFWCSGGSIEMITLGSGMACSGAFTMSRVAPLADEYVSWSLVAGATSSYRVSA